MSRTIEQLVFLAKEDDIASFGKKNLYIALLRYFIQRAHWCW